MIVDKTGSTTGISRHDYLPSVKRFLRHRGTHDTAGIHFQ